MLISSKDLIGLTVETASGQRLGHVLRFDVDVESHLVTTYYVGSSLPLVGEFLRAERLIRREQVVGITKEKMVVDDAVTRAVDQERERVKASVQATAVAMTLRSDSGSPRTD